MSDNTKVLPFRASSETAPSEAIAPFHPESGSDTLTDGRQRYSRGVGGGEPPDNGEMVMLKARIDAIEKSLTTLQDTVDRHYTRRWVAAIAFLVMVVGAAWTLNVYFDGKVEKLSDKIQTAQNQITQTAERLNGIEKDTDKIVSKDELIGIMHQVLDARKANHADAPNN